MNKESLKFEEKKELTMEGFKSFKKVLDVMVTSGDIKEIEKKSPDPYSFYYADDSKSVWKLRAPDSPISGSFTKLK